MKIGIMGGTFDPIHNGHLMLGNYAYKLFRLDQVWFLPNGNPPHKSSAAIESMTVNRVEMVQKAIQPYAYFRLEKYEVERKEISYSYQTMQYFQDRYPEHEFYFIIGADSLFSIEKWVHPEKLLRPSFTNLSPIYNSPELISSSPAIIRSVVDFPHPEGPTKMMNSLSAISRLKSLTATKPFGYTLLMFLNDKLAII